MTRLARLRGLLGRRKRKVLTLIEAVLALVGTACALRLIGYTRTTNWMHRSLRQHRPWQPPTHCPRQIGEAINAVAIVTRLAGGSITCLPRACALQWLLARRGYDARICFGVRPAHRGVEAHAWVELAGMPVGESAALGSAFIPLRSRVGQPPSSGPGGNETTRVISAQTCGK